MAQTVLHVVQRSVVEAMRKPAHEDYLTQTGLLQFVTRVPWTAYPKCPWSVVEQFIRNFSETRSSTSVDGVTISLTLDSIRRVFFLHEGGHTMKTIIPQRYKPRGMGTVNKNSSYTIEECKDPLLKERLHFLADAVWIPTQTRDTLPAYKIWLAEESTPHSLMNWAAHFASILLVHVKRDHDTLTADKAIARCFYCTHIMILINQLPPGGDLTVDGQRSAVGPQKRPSHVCHDGNNQQVEDPMMHEDSPKVKDSDVESYPLQGDQEHPRTREGQQAGESGGPANYGSPDNMMSMMSDEDCHGPDVVSKLQDDSPVGDGLQDGGPDNVTVENDPNPPEVHVEDIQRTEGRSFSNNTMSIHEKQQQLEEHIKCMRGFLKNTVERFETMAGVVDDLKREAESSGGTEAINRNEGSGNPSTNDGDKRPTPGTGIGTENQQPWGTTSYHNERIAESMCHCMKPCCLRVGLRLFIRRVNHNDLDVEA